VLKQTKGYVEAISGSIAAARKGHAFASECLGAVDELVKDPNTKGNFESMLKIGRSALEIANGALDGFRQVRQELHQVRAIYSLRELLPAVFAHTSSSGDRISEKKPEDRRRPERYVDKRFMPSSTDNADPNGQKLQPAIELLEQGAPLLETYQQSVDSYVKWWTEILMRQKSSDNKMRYLKPEELRSNLRLTQAKVQWESFKNEYEAYVDKVGGIIFDQKDSGAETR